MAYKSINDIKDKGPCLVPGESHKGIHRLELACWTSIRRYLFDHTFQEFLEESRKK